MTKTDLILTIRTYCQANANEELAQKYNYYFKEKQNFYGLTAPMMNDYAKHFLKENTLTLSVLLETAPDLLMSDKCEETTLLILLLQKFAKQFTPDLLQELNKWYSLGIRNWAHADSMAMYILHEFHSRNYIHYSALKPWLSSKEPFQRRSVAVSMVKWVKKHQNVAELLAFNEPLMNDSVREVHQGIGWFLRECWKVQPGVTEDFLLKYKDISARLIFQYACEKMTMEDKERFRNLKTRKKRI